MFNKSQKERSIEQSCRKITAYKKTLAKYQKMQAVFVETALHTMGCMGITPVWQYKQSARAVTGRNPRMTLAAARKVARSWAISWAESHEIEGIDY